MTTLAGSAAVDAPAGEAPGARGVLSRSFLRVVGFWWLATGVIVALQRNRWTSLVAFAAATVALAVGVRLVHRTRDDRTPRGAQLAFVGGAFVWLWIQMLFYGGWAIGPADGVLIAEPGPTVANALLAIRATAYNEALSIAAIAWALIVHQRNPMGWQTLLAFWGADQVAKLNVFLGVANPSAHFLPEHLYFLLAFFGPESNSGFLPVSIVGLGAITAWLLYRVRSSPDGGVREGASLLAVLLGLATLEHLLLAIPWQLPLWEPFLRARGG